MKGRNLSLLIVMAVVAPAVAHAQLPNTASPATPPPSVRPRTVTAPAPLQSPPSSSSSSSPSAPPRVQPLQQSQREGQASSLTSPQASSPAPTTPSTSVVGPRLPISPTVAQPAQSPTSPTTAQTALPPVTPNGNDATDNSGISGEVKSARTISLSKVRAKLTEAQRLLKARSALTSTAVVAPTAMVMGAATTAAAAPSLYTVRLTLLDADASQIHLLTLPKATFLRKDGFETTLTTSTGSSVRLRTIRSNFVNTAITAFDNTGRQLTPLIVEYPIEKFGQFREMAYYTSVHPALVSPDLVKAGEGYVHSMIDLAAKRLRDKGVHIEPQVVDMAERLCIVEHVDHDRFRRESRRALYEEVYALYALNELDTYRYSVSTAGAGGMVQMIPWTYQMIRTKHPAVGLNPDFVLGMRNHGNALEAMLLYMQGTWNDLKYHADIADALDAKIATPAELMAAGYNSNPARLASYIRRGGTAWRTLIPRETQMYLQIHSSLESTMPLKERRTKDKTE